LETLFFIDWQWNRSDRWLWTFLKLGISSIWSQCRADLWWELVPKLISCPSPTNFFSFPPSWLQSKLVIKWLPDNWITWSCFQSWFSKLNITMFSSDAITTELPVGDAIAQLTSLPYSIVCLFAELDLTLDEFTWKLEWLILQILIKFRSNRKLEKDNSSIRSSDTDVIWWS